MKFYGAGLGDWDFGTGVWGLGFRTMEKQNGKDKTNNDVESGHLEDSVAGTGSGFEALSLYRKSHIYIYIYMYIQGLRL